MVFFDFLYFLLSYWWILLLIIVVVAVITKKLIKVLIGLVVIFVVLLIFFALFLHKPSKVYVSCAEPEVERMQSIIDSGLSLPQGAEQRAVLCGDTLRESMETTRQCLLEAKQVASGQVFSLLIPFLVHPFGEMVEIHNAACPDNQMEPLLFE